MVYDVLTLFSPHTKVFWKGEFEGKNLFFKKGFPLIIKLEKTSIIGRQLAGDRKFFQVGEAMPAKNRVNGSIFLAVVLPHEKRNTKRTNIVKHAFTPIVQL